MTIRPGQSIPSVTIKQANPSGGEEVDPVALFAGKRVVLFSLPGAFTPTCSAKHLPGYLARYDELSDPKYTDIGGIFDIMAVTVIQTHLAAHP